MLELKHLRSPKATEQIVHVNILISVCYEVSGSGPEGAEVFPLATWESWRRIHQGLNIRHVYFIDEVLPWPVNGLAFAAALPLFTFRCPCLFMFISVGVTNIPGYQPCFSCLAASRQHHRHIIALAGSY